MRVGDVHALFESEHVAQALVPQRVWGLSRRLSGLVALDSSVDVVISNGVLNLTTDKQAAFSEIERVLRPGGRLLLADIVVADELSEGIRSDIDLWTG